LTGAPKLPDMNVDTPQRAERPVGRTARPTPTTTTRPLAQRVRRVAAGLLAATGALHLALVPEYLNEKAYIGVLFILGGGTALAVAARLWKAADPRAWALGALTAAGMAAGFILSRSTGLPGFHPTDWELSGVLSVVLELGFLATLAWYARSIAQRPNTRPATA
jgi:hypothetical protein